MNYKVLLCSLLVVAGFVFAGTVSAQGPTPTPVAINCANYVSQWRVDSIYLSVDGNGNHGFRVNGYFPQIKMCGRRKPNPLSGDYSLVYTFKGTSGTEEKSYYLHTSTQVKAITESYVDIGNIYKFSVGTHTGWLLYCTGNATMGICQDGMWSYKPFTINISNPTSTPTPTPTPVALAAPTNFKAQCSADHKNVVLSWTAPTGATGKYNLVVSYEPYGVAQTRNTQVVTGTTVTTYTYWNSAGYEKVKMRAAVRAVSAGDTDYSTRSSAATVDFHCPYPPPTAAPSVTGVPTCPAAASTSKIPAPEFIIPDDYLTYKQIADINGKYAYEIEAGKRKLNFGSNDTTGYRYYVRIDDESDGKSCTGPKDYCPAVPNTQTAKSVEYEFEAGKQYRVWVHHADSCNNWSADVASIYLKGYTATPVGTACTSDDTCKGNVYCVKGKCEASCSAVRPTDGSVVCYRGYLVGNVCTETPKPDGSYCSEGMAEYKKTGVCLNGICKIGEPTPAPGCKYVLPQCANGVRAEDCKPILVCDGSPTPTPAPDCRYQSKGDADCNLAIDSKDRLIWAKFYLQQEIPDKKPHYSGDFNKDGKVNLVDAEIWRMSLELGVLKDNPTLTVYMTQAPTPTPPFDMSKCMPVTQDAFVNEFTPNEAYGTSTAVAVGSESTLNPKAPPGGKFYYNAFFRFNSEPADKANSKFTLWVYHLTDRKGGGTFEVNKVLSDWDENTITWNNRPKYDETTTLANVTKIGDSDFNTWVAIPLPVGPSKLPYGVTIHDANWLDTECSASLDARVMCSNGLSKKANLQSKESPIAKSYICWE